MDSHKDAYQRSAESAAREFARWPEWKKTPPTAPIDRRANGSSDYEKKDQPTKR
jgi:hypothetical protein